MRVFAKYVWVARYHNYVCKVVPDAADYSLDWPALNAKRLAAIVSR